MLPLGKIRALYRPEKSAEEISATKGMIAYLCIILVSVAIYLAPIFLNFSSATTQFWEVKFTQETPDLNILTI